MTTKEVELSDAINNSVKNTINKKGAIGLITLIIFGTVGLFSFYSNTNQALESAQAERVTIKASINSLSESVNQNQIGRLENRQIIISVQESLNRVIELQLLILEKID